MLWPRWPPRSKNLNGHISAMGHWIHFTCGSMVGLLESVDGMALLPTGPNLRWQPAAIWENKIKWPYLCSGSSDPLHFWFYNRVFRVGRPNGATSGWSKSEMAAGRNVKQERLAVADKPTRCVRNVCTIYVRAVGL